MIRLPALVVGVATLTGAFAASAQNGVTVTMGLGPSLAPAYFGSQEYEAGVTGAFRLNALRFGGLGFGEPGILSDRLGWGLRGAFAYVPARRGSDHPELAGLNDIDAAIELGLGVGYDAPAWGAFADLRRGVTGHSGTVGVLGVDLKHRVSDRLLLTAGPRATLGSDGYTSTYFGVTPTEAGASGLTAFDASGGLVSTGVELGASYDLGNDWGIEGKIGFTRLRGDAAGSPITAQGSETSGSASILLTRRFTLRF